VRWKADGSYTNAQKWDDSSKAWVDASWGSIPAKSTGTFMEIGLTRMNFGLPSSSPVLFSMAREAVGNEWTWASVPSSSITDGKNVSYAKYFLFDFTSSNAPNSYAPLP
jgi:hypothetical protein